MGDPSRFEAVADWLNSEVDPKFPTRPADKSSTHRQNIRYTFQSPITEWGECVP